MDGTIGMGEDLWEHLLVCIWMVEIDRWKDRSCWEEWRDGGGREGRSYGHRVKKETDQFESGEALESQ